MTCLSPPPIKIAIVSDLHIGRGAREFDLRPGGTPPFAGHRGYLDYFRERVESLSLTADVLVVSGDITHEAQPSQFMHAADIVRSIAETLGVPDDRILVVPGNHDLNWDMAQLAATKNETFWLDYIFAPFSAGHRAIGCPSAACDSLINPPHFFHRALAGADFWCFNSAAYDLPEVSPHRGSIREQHRLELRHSLTAAYGDRPKQEFRVLITHHHLTSEPDVYGDDPDFSTMVNGDSLLSLLMEYKFDLVVHGHKHRPWSRHMMLSGGHPIFILCAGSFSQTLGPQYAGTVGNLWHLVELQGVEPPPNAYGLVKSWAFAPSQGWVASRAKEHGIDHITPFGYLSDRPTIERLVKHCLANCFDDKGYVSWDELCAGQPALQYQPGPVVWSILEEMSPRTGFRLHGEQNSLERLLLLKEPE